MKKSVSTTSGKKRTGSPLKRMDTYTSSINNVHIPLEDRVQMMIKKGVADQFEVDEYQKTEIIRKSVMDVKERAAEARERRTSPHKAYANVKSKVAGNLKS